MGRRTETTEYLKECMADALLRKLTEKPLEKITVEEIVRTAGVGRTTYFRCFSSKEDVLIYKVERLWNRWTEEHPLPSNAALPRERLLQFFSFCCSQKDLLLFLYQQQEIELILDTALKGIVLRAQMPDKARYREMYQLFGMVGVMLVWVRNGCQGDPEELADICSGTTPIPESEQQAAAAALGLEPAR